MVIWLGLWNTLFHIEAEVFFSLVLWQVYPVSQANPQNLQLTWLLVLSWFLIDWIAIYDGDRCMLVCKTWLLQYMSISCLYIMDFLICIMYAWPGHEKKVNFLLVASPSLLVLDFYRWRPGGLGRQLQWLKDFSFVFDFSLVLTMIWEVAPWYFFLLGILSLTLLER